MNKNKFPSRAKPAPPPLRNGAARVSGSASTMRPCSGGRLSEPAQRDGAFLDHGVVAACTARHDGGYLCRLDDGRAGVSIAPLACGARATLRADGRVEAAR